MIANYTLRDVFTREILITCLDLGAQRLEMTVESDGALLSGASFL